MIMNIIIPTTEIKNALGLLTHMVSAHTQRKNKQYNIVAICDTKTSTLTLKTAYANNTYAHVLLAVEIESAQIVSPCCFEIKVDFVFILLEKIKKQYHHVKLEVDSEKQTMRVAPGEYKKADLISVGGFADVRQHGNELSHAIKTIDSLADYDFSPPELSSDPTQLFATDIKFIKHLNKFYKEQMALASDFVSIVFDDNQIRIESTPFSTQLVSRCKNLNNTVVLDSNAFNLFQLASDNGALSAKDLLYLDVHEAALILHSSKVLIYQDTQPLVNRALVLKLSGSSEIVINTGDLKSALSNLDSKQKKNDDIISISFVEDEMARLRFTSEPTAGRLTRSARIVWSTTDASNFDVFTHRGAFLASLDLFLNEQEIILFGLSDSNDEFFVTNKSRSKYAVLQKLC